MTTNTRGVTAHLERGILHLTLSRPERMNAVTTDTLDALAELLDQFADEPAVRTVLLTGAGRAFCTGADLDGADPGKPASPAIIDAAAHAVATIRRFDRPIVGAVNGVAAGVGVSLALACDITVAAESSYFLLAFTKIGLMPDGGATALVAASIGRARAMKMALLAEKLTAAHAHAAGLIAEVFPDESFADSAHTLARSLADGPTTALHHTKSAVNDATLGNLDQAFSRERVGQLTLLQTEDFAEGVAAFEEKRAPRFRGC